jgi:two-component system, NarL family, sensor kinase
MQELQFYAVLIGITMILGTVLISFIVLLSKAQQRKKAEYNRLNLLAEVIAQEKDRARITYQLHEDFGATLSAIRMGISSFQLQRPDDRLQQEQFKGFIDDIITKIRTIASDFLPGTIQQKWLVAALREFVQTVKKEQSVSQILLDAEELPELSEYKTINLYRIVQEIVYNTIKHARATTLLINLKHDGKRILLTTQDNGIGFNYRRELERQKGIGLHNMANRILLLNGVVDVLSEEGKGTLYMIQVPLAERDATE